MPETNSTNTRPEDPIAAYADMGILARMRVNPMLDNMLFSQPITSSNNTGSDLDTATPESDTENIVMDPLEELAAQMERRQNERKFDHAITID